MWSRTSSLARHCVAFSSLQDSSKTHLFSSSSPNVYSLMYSACEVTLVIIDTISGVHIYTYVYIFKYIYVRVCVRVCATWAFSAKLVPKSRGVFQKPSLSPERVGILLYGFLDGREFKYNVNNISNWQLYSHPYLVRRPFNGNLRTT